MQKNTNIIYRRFQKYWNIHKMEIPENIPYIPNKYPKNIPKKLIYQ